MEFEIKVSVQDFKAERRKQQKHDKLRSRKRGIPNYFVYACPEGLLTPDQVPEYAGLVYVTQKKEVIEVKKPPVLHRLEATDSQRHRLLKVCMYKVWEKAYAPKGWKFPKKSRNIRNNQRRRKKIKERRRTKRRRGGRFTSR